MVGMTERPNDGTPNAERDVLGPLRRVRTVALILVVLLPPSLNAQNIVEWAYSANGLNLPIVWAWIAFGGLDMIAAVCVLETIIQTRQGRKAGAFAALVWAFAAASAFAGYRHGTQPGAGRDVKWFFPLMAVAGPTLMHLILKRSRLDKQLDQGKRLTHAPAASFGWGRWIPGIGAFGETFCSWRVGRLEGIVLPAEAIARYRTLLPDAGRSGYRVLRAMRAEADRERAIAAAPNAIIERSPTAATERTVPRPANATKRTTTRVPGKAAKANATPPQDERMAAVRSQFADRRDSPPPVSEVAMFLGVAKSTAHPYQKMLIAEFAEQVEPDPLDRDRQLAMAETG